MKVKTFLRHFISGSYFVFVQKKGNCKFLYTDVMDLLRGTVVHFKERCVKCIVTLFRVFRNLFI